MIHCNAPHGYTRTIESMNGGRLRHAEADTSLPYKLLVRTDGALEEIDLTQVHVTRMDRRPSNQAQSDLAARIGDPDGAVYAGEYTDTVTIRIELE